MADSPAQKIVSFLVENRPLDCKLCKTTVAFQDKKTGEVIGVGLSCDCLGQFVVDAALSALGKGPTVKKGEDFVDRGSGKGNIGKQQELEESMKELKLREEASLKYAREQEARQKEREEEAARKVQEQEKALKKLREEEEFLKKQKMEEEEARRLKEEQALKRLKEEQEAMRKLKEEQARRRLKEEEEALRKLREGQAQRKLQEEEQAREREKRRQKLADEEEAAKKARAASKMDLSIRSWSGMKYSPNLKSGAVVHVVFGWTPIDFQVVCDKDAEPLEILQEDLMARVSAGKLKKINGKPQQDDVVIAEYDGSYYRARVSKSSAAQCQLSFIDYGDKAIKKNEEIYEIPEDLYKAPIYGLKVRLDGLDTADFTEGALLSAEIETSLYATVYSLELMKKIDMNDGYTSGILRDIKEGQTLNEVVKKTLR